MNEDYSPRYYWKMEYIPSYYDGLTEEQLRNQRIVLDFKEGLYDENIMVWFRQKIWKIAWPEEYSWSICFMPCSTDEEQQKRFGKLADYLKKKTRVDVYLSTFGFAEEHLPSHQNGKSKINIKDIDYRGSDIFDKNVILIDDVYTTGNTFNSTAKKALQAGANFVIGLFLAKTIHPNLPLKKQPDSRRENRDALLQREAEIMNRLSNLPSNENNILQTN